MNIISNKTGWIEVICGCMFSGKTEELAKRLRRAIYAKQKVIVFKPSQDNRFSTTDIVSRNNTAHESIAVKNPEDILKVAEGKEVVAIDEVQFFDSSVVKIANELANRGIRVIAAGLDMDFQGKPFGPMPALIATAEYVTKVHAICMRCGDLAHISHRTVVGDKLVMLGETESYEPLCRACFNKAIKENAKKPLEQKEKENS